MPRMDSPDATYPTMHHSFKWARITKLYPSEDTADIEIVDKNDQSTGETYNQVPLFFHCKPDSELRPNGALDGASSAFEVNDIVIVRFEDGDPLIVGLRDGKRECRLNKLLAMEVDWNVVDIPNTSCKRIFLNQEVPAKFYGLYYNEEGIEKAELLSEVPFLPASWDNSYYFELLFDRWKNFNFAGGRSLDYPVGEKPEDRIPLIGDEWTKDILLFDSEARQGYERLEGYRESAWLRSDVRSVIENFGGYIEGVRFFTWTPYFHFYYPVTLIWIQGVGWLPWDMRSIKRYDSGIKVSSVMDYFPEEKKLVIWSWFLCCGYIYGDVVAFRKAVFDVSWKSWVLNSEESLYEEYWGRCRRDWMWEDDYGRYHWKGPQPDWFSPPMFRQLLYDPFGNKRAVGIERKDPENGVFSPFYTGISHGNSGTIYLGIYDIDQSSEQWLFSKTWTLATPYDESWWNVLDSPCYLSDYGWTYIAPCVKCYHLLRGEGNISSASGIHVYNGDTVFPSPFPSSAPQENFIAYEEREHRLESYYSSSYDNHSCSEGGYECGCSSTKEVCGSIGDLCSQTAPISHDSRLGFPLSQDFSLVYSTPDLDCRVSIRYSLHMLVSEGRDNQNFHLVREGVLNHPNPFRYSFYYVGNQRKTGSLLYQIKEKLESCGAQFSRIVQIV